MKVDKNIIVGMTDRIEELCKEKDFDFAGLERASKLTTNTIRRWRTSVPNVLHVAKVAETLHVSTDYLVGLSSSRTSFEEYNNISPKAGEIMTLIKELPDEKLDLIQRYILVINS